VHAQIVLFDGFDPLDTDRIAGHRLLVHRSASVDPHRAATAPFTNTAIAATLTAGPAFISSSLRVFEFEV
jgi:hypothetical protein